MYVMIVSSSSIAISKNFLLKSRLPVRHSKSQALLVGTIDIVLPRVHDTQISKKNRVALRCVVLRAVSVASSPLDQSLAKVAKPLDELLRTFLA
eukprot:SAG31_NODE_10436_length_1139_cov_1.335577_1_plen_94_part_00